MSKAKRAKREKISPELEYEVSKSERFVESKKAQAKNTSQSLYLESIRSSIITFGIGPAGTGKTYLAACEAADALKDKKVSRIIITRPAVEAGEELGFLPGTLEEKFDPYFRPVKGILEQRLGRSQVEYLIKRQVIEALPMAYMRGHTFDNSFVLFDEAQNASVVQMKLLLTRIGMHSRVVVNGDIKQKDVPGASGLEDALRRLQSVNGVGIVEFSRGDIVRSGIAQKIVEMYETP